MPDPPQIAEEGKKTVRFEGDRTNKAQIQRHIVETLRWYGTGPGVIDVNDFYECIREVSTADFLVDLSVEESRRYNEQGHSVKFARWLAVTSHYKHAISLLDAEDQRVKVFLISMLYLLHREIESQGKDNFSLSSIYIMELFVAVAKLLMVHDRVRTNHNVSAMLKKEIDVNDLVLSDVAEHASLKIPFL